MGKMLDKVLRESREEFGTREARRVDWESVDTKLFEEIHRARRARRVSIERSLSWPRAVVIALPLAAAAILALTLRSRPHSGAVGRDSSAPASTLEAPGEAVVLEGSGEEPGAGGSTTGERALRVGDVVETGSSSVRLRRPGKVTMIVEAHSRVRVSSKSATLVLELLQGAVEAQVTPVPHGEAFAVDVEGSRVAVHGTHLRVQRDGLHVIVDVNEGVIAVGEAPRTGEVAGAIVSATAHAEFQASDVLGTLRVTRDPAVQRWPATPAAAPSRGAGVEPPPAAEAASSRSASVSTVETRGQPRGASSAPQPVAVAATERDLSDLVRRCMAERPHAENVTILVKTTLSLTLGNDGWVQTARFDPPVAPDVNACAAASIYRIQFDHGGTVTVPIDFKN